MRLFLMIFSRTDLRISVSRAKNCKESDCDVHFCVAPSITRKKKPKNKKFDQKICDKKILTWKN